MKYSEFLQFEELLHENNLTYDDIRENQRALNEIGIGAALIGGAIAAGLGTIFGKNLLRLGIKKVYLLKLKNVAKKFENQILSKTSSIGKKTVDIRQSIIRKEKELRAQEGEEVQAEMQTLLQRKSEYERKISKEINEFISKVSSLKTKEVYEKIDELKKLKESQKTAIKGYWEMQIVDIRINAFNKLIEDGVITDKDIINTLKQDFADEKKEAKQKLINIAKDIKSEEKEKEDVPEEITVQKISDNIRDLSSEKEKYNPDELERKVRLIMKDIKKLGKDSRLDMYEKLADEFGKDYIIKLRKSSSDTEDKPREKQTILKSEDNL